MVPSRVELRRASRRASRCPLNHPHSATEQQSSDCRRLYRYRERRGLSERTQYCCKNRWSERRPANMLLERPATRTARSFLRCFASSSKAYVTGAGKMALLPSQGVYRVTGPDSPKFLKGLTCKDVERIGGGYTGFLNATVSQCLDTQLPLAYGSRVGSCIPTLSYRFQAHPHLAT